MLGSVAETTILFYFRGSSPERATVLVPLAQPRDRRAAAEHAAALLCFLGDSLKFW